MDSKPVKKPYAKPVLIEYGSLNTVIRAAKYGMQGEDNAGTQKTLS